MASPVPALGTRTKIIIKSRLKQGLFNRRSEPRPAKEAGWLARLLKAFYDAAHKQTVIGVREISENLMLPPQR